MALNRKPNWLCDYSKRFVWMNCDGMAIESVFTLFAAYSSRPVKLVNMCWRWVRCTPAMRMEPHQNYSRNFGEWLGGWNFYYCRIWFLWLSFTTHKNAACCLRCHGRAKIYVIDEEIIGKLNRLTYHSFLKSIRDDNSLKIMP